MNDLIKKFEFDGETIVRMIERDNEQWFVARDLVQAVGATWGGHCLDHVPFEWKALVSVTTCQQKQEVRVLSEAGMNFYLIRSDKPKALPIQKWLASEVIPSIRKTGSYGAIDPMKVLNDPAAMRGLLLTYTEKVLALEVTVAEERERANKAAEEAEEMRPAAAALDRIADTTGLLSITETAKTLQVKPKALIAWLLASGWIYRRGELLAYQDKIDDGLMQHKRFSIKQQDDSIKTVTHAYITPKGLTKLAKRVPGAVPSTQMNLLIGGPKE